MSRRLPKNHICPCGSGKKYGDCCITKDFKWVKDENGNICKEIPITTDVVLAIKDFYQDYVSMFGREPDPDEPIFYRLLLFEGIDEAWERGYKIMEEIGVDPALIYASRKTQRIVTDFNKGFLSDIELQEWQDAVDEYYSLSNDYCSEQMKDELLLDFIKKHMERCILMLATIVDKCGNLKGELSDDFSQFNIRDFQFYCLTKALKTMQFIFENIEEKKFSEEMLNLTRSIYENYLHITFLNTTPQRFNDIIASKTKTISNKSHNSSHLKKDKITTNEMAKQSKYPEDIEIRNYLYSHLCEFTHPGLLAISSYINDDQCFDHRVISSNSWLWAAILDIFLGTLILNEVFNIEGVDNIFKRDILYHNKQIKPFLSDIFKSCSEKNIIQSLPNAFQKRVKHLQVS